VAARRQQEEPMQYRTYGRNGPQVSALGYGAMRLPMRKDRLNATRSQLLLRRALRLGVNFFDSHHFYLNGLSEGAIGRAIKGFKSRHPIVVQTKTPFYQDKPVDYFKRLLDQAVEKLGAAPIDYLLFHSMTMDMFRRRGRQFFRFTDWAMKRGLIRHRGFSSHDSVAHVKAFVDTGEFAAMLLSYNWLNRKMAECIAYGAARGMGVSVMNPIGGGQLAMPHPRVLNLLPGAKSSAEVGLRFVMGTPGVAVALSGMDRIEQIDENARIASRRVPLTPRQRTVMASRLALARKAQDELCTSCGYCTPCPCGVDIPACFRLLHSATYFGLMDYAKRQYKWLIDHNMSGQSCKKCGRCLPKCPNNLPIVDRLAETVKLLS
jgi:predicted aldo/keto reductase-like oxidoreductase